MFTIKKYISFFVFALVFSMMLVTAHALLLPPEETDSALHTLENGVAIHHYSIPLPDEKETNIYRGQIAEILPEGSIVVAQLEGFDYGQPEVQFTMDENTRILPKEDLALQEGCFVEVVYSTNMTRSIPPQTTPYSITVLSRTSEDVVVNGEVVSVMQESELYHIEINRLNENGVASADKFVLLAPAGSFEEIAPEEIRTGVQISAVTTGTELALTPQQMPVQVLLPYTVPSAT